MYQIIKPLKILLLIGLLQGCTSVVVDEHKTSVTNSQWQQGEQALVLGRRHSSNYETELSLVSCVADELRSNTPIEVIDELAFINQLYPWFEPRTAPMRLKDMKRLLRNQQIATALQQRNLRYIIWINGNTETTKSSGSIGCAISVGGGGCFGFGSWEKESDYQATIWDLKESKNLGEISADASGTSYMPAVIIPIPLIARVQSNACEAMSQQLTGFFNTGGSDR
ncbi:MAG: hypothetical protein AseanaTS_05900 [Candidatus Pelagadaptatus aseana]|uniref:hypothetical protein n=1 Tax=Candidatus Pelagadaptatus aseana TaxID=3120508 RepID=UPI0039B186AD